MRGDLLATVRGALTRSGLEAERLELELTESVLIRQSDRAEAVLDALSALGVRLAMDDFGTGYSSLASLKRLPIDTLKIDRSFVREMPQDAGSSAIAQAVVVLAHAYELRVVGKGVGAPSRSRFSVGSALTPTRAILLQPAGARGRDRAPAGWGGTGGCRLSYLFLSNPVDPVCSSDPMRHDPCLSLSAESPGAPATEPLGLAVLEARVGRVHLQRRLDLEAENEQRVLRFGTRLFHFENWYSVHALIRMGLRLAGLHGRAQRNARRVLLRRHEVVLKGLPPAFDGYRILHISDPHLDMSPDITDALIERVRGLDYDLCVFTGDYRTCTFGPYGPALEAMRRVRATLRDPVLAVLGNHDTIRMVPGLEAMGIRVLLNESLVVRRGTSALFIAGIDDAHYYRLASFEKAAAQIPPGETAILLSHTPEVYRHAAQAGFRLMLCGHTHGGQICLPGGIPLVIDADCPRRYARGAWRYRNLVGYTSAGSGVSIVDVRLNCPPEVTLHRLCAA